MAPTVEQSPAAEAADLAAYPIDEFRLRFRALHGYRRAFRQAGPLDGSRPVLLLVHGIGQDSSTWSTVLTDLARDYTVIAPDLLGHGASAKPRADYAVGAYACGLRDLLTVLGVDRVTVVGHSLGGGVAMQFAYQFPERCERLVLVSSGGAGREVHPLLRLASLPGAELVMPIATAAPVRKLARLLSDVVGAVGGELTQDLEFMLSSYDRLARATSRRAFLRTLRSVVDVRGQVVTGLDRCYLAAGVPTLLIWGARDGVTPFAHAARAHEAMPGSRLEAFAEAGHFPHHTDPVRFLRVLRTFLAETEPAEYDRDRWREQLLNGRTPDADDLVADTDGHLVSSGS
ncbi:MAG TPA: alpha/beta fold hydrolase [Frankiaceae bacterium]|nr:alpha/beta fold hydrolase [Frankiaceae bacterium]